MPRRYRRKTYQPKIGAFFRRPIVQLGILAVIIVVIYILAITAGK